MIAIAMGLLLWGWPWSGLPGGELVKLSIPEDCAAPTLQKVDKAVSKEDRDVLVWRIDNTCTQTVDVVLLAPAGSPFACIGEPRKAVINSHFPMGPGERVYVVCTVDYSTAPKTYNFQLNFTTAVTPGPTPPTEAAPTPPPTPRVPYDRWPRNSEIAIEVEP